VITLTTSDPQFYANVLGIISKADANANKANYYVGSIVLALATNLWDNSISKAPPPGTNLGFTITFLATVKQSYKFLSISFKTSLEAPLNKIVQAAGFLHCVKNV